MGDYFYVDFDFWVIKLGEGPVAKVLTLLGGWI